MKAIVQNGYGSPDSLELSEVDRGRLGGQRRVDAAVALDIGGARILAGSDATKRRSEESEQQQRPPHGH